MPDTKLIGPFSQILPLSDLPFRGALKDDRLSIVPNGGVLVRKGQIIAVGSFERLREQADTIEHLEGDHVALPGFVDAHTHICYAGSRATDYALRNSGKSYLEIAKAGGGIWDTVTHTRKSSEEDLVLGIQERCTVHLKNGVTTLEVKSGYGLNVHEELKMLRAIKRAQGQVPQDLVPTCLAAHMVPRDWKGSSLAYLEELSKLLFPLLVSEKLTNRIDAFIEDSAFTPEEIAPYFKKATSMGFQVTVHADQFTTGGSALADRFGAVSADHLEASGDREIDLLGKSGTVAVALPGASIGLGCAFAPARKLLDAGACLAIASDYNPGSGPMGNLLVQASILGAFEKLSNAEVLAGMTARAARALRLDDRGTLEPGKKADIVAFPTDNYQEITYNQGQLRPSSVWKNGTKTV